MRVIYLDNLSLRRSQLASCAGKEQEY